MSETDDFDEFLKSGFEKNNFNMADEGFTERVISNLPAKRVFTINRNFIIYFSAALSVLIFFISSGYKAILLSVTDILNHGFHPVSSSLMSVFVILVFISVSFIISRIEHNEDFI